MQAQLDGCPSSSRAPSCASYGPHRGPGGLVVQAPAVAPSCAPSCATSCANGPAVLPSRRAYGLVAQELGCAELLCPQLCPTIAIGSPRIASPGRGCPSSCAPSCAPARASLSLVAPASASSLCEPRDCKPWRWLPEQLCPQLCSQLCLLLCQPTIGSPRGEHYLVGWHSWSVAQQLGATSCASCCANQP